MKIFSTIITTALLFSAIDNTSAQEITIEGVTWSTKNLDVSTFRNGDVIPEAKTNEEWIKAGENATAAWCYYDNDPANGKKYGKLYNFYAVIDERGIAPEGWHVATYYEWEALRDFLGGSSYAGKKLKSVAGWTSNENGNNESGMNVLPAGYRGVINFGADCEFAEVGARSQFWTSTEDDYGAWFKLVSENESSYLDTYPKSSGLSVRCVKD